MTSKNDVTGDSLVSKVASEDYRKNYDNIFGKKDKPEQHKAVDDTAGIEEESNDKS